MINIRKAAIFGSLMCSTALIGFSGLSLASENEPSFTTTAISDVPGEYIRLSDGTYVPAPDPEELKAHQETVNEQAILKDRAYTDAIRQAFPLSADQVLSIRRQADKIDDAMTGDYQEPPTEVKRSIDLTLKPGEDSPVIRTLPGYIATITFSDQTGAPWPVRNIANGRPDAFQVQSAGEEGTSNIIVISTIKDEMRGNMVITLVDHPVPVTVTLSSLKQETDVKSVDYRSDIRIMRRGPNATQEISTTIPLPATQDRVLISFLDGTPPEGSTMLRSNMADVEAWLYEGDMFVRSSYQLGSPAYLAKSTNVSGVNVFMLKETPSLLMFNGGRLFSVSISR